MVKVYHKLVRDKIPQIIEENGSSCVTQILSDEEYVNMLDAKLSEELAEYRQSGDVEELADLLEVIYAVADARGYSREALEAIRWEKAQKRGSFRKKILLKEVTEG